MQSMASLLAGVFLGMVITTTAATVLNQTHGEIIVSEYKPDPKLKTMEEWVAYEEEQLCKLNEAKNRRLEAKKHGKKKIRQVQHSDGGY